MIGKSLSFAFEVMKCLRCLFRMAPMSINYNVEVTLSQSPMGFEISCAVKVFKMAKPGVGRFQVLGSKNLTQ